MLLIQAVISLCLIAMTGITVVDVAGRYFLNAPLKGGYEISEMILKRVPTRAGYLDHIPHGDAAMVTGIIQNRDGQLGHCCQGDLLSLNLEGKSAHLLL